ncbi:MAG: hypothetical protein O2904_00875 [bacterium]|nr:hypothetical protein [bacterium]
MKNLNIQQAAESIVSNCESMHVYITAGRKNPESHKLQKVLMALGCTVTNRAYHTALQ